MTKPSGAHRGAAPPRHLPLLAEPQRLTLDAMFTHPLPYVGWTRVLALFNVLGMVEAKADDEFAFRIGAGHHLLHKPHGENLSVPEVAVLHGSGSWHSCPSPGCASGNTYEGRASKLHHTAERMDGDVDPGRPAPVRARAQPGADHSHEPADGRPGASPPCVAGRFLPRARLCSVMLCRWRSRCVGMVAAVSLGTAVDCGGTTTAAAGRRSATRAETCS